MSNLQDHEVPRLQRGHIRVTIRKGKEKERYWWFTFMSHKTGVKEEGYYKYTRQNTYRLFLDLGHRDGGPWIGRWDEKVGVWFTCENRIGARSVQFLRGDFVWSYRNYERSTT